MRRHACHAEPVYVHSLSLSRRRKRLALHNDYTDVRTLYFSVVRTTDYSEKPRARGERRHSRHSPTELDRFNRNETCIFPFTATNELVADVTPFFWYKKVVGPGD